MSDLPFLPYGRQQIDEDDITAVTAVLRSDFLTTGPEIPAFEQAFSEKVGARHAVACSSGTAALHLAALAAGLAPGDAAIVPSVTFVATSNCARYVGAEVVFADVDPANGLMRPDHLADALARAEGAGLRPRAVLPVHYAGQTCDMPALADIAHSRDLIVIEDACHAVGGRGIARAEADGTVGACAHSAMTVFSGHPVKSFAMGEGGVVTTNDDRLHEALARLRNHGLVRDHENFTDKGSAFDPSGNPNPWYYEMPEIGFNYRATDMQCALGRSQLAKLDGFVATRRQLAQCYDRALQGLAPLVRPLAPVPGCDPAWHLYVVRIDFAAAGISRGALMNRLRDRGIGSQVHYIPVHHQPYYRERYGTTELPGADTFYEHCLSLPLFTAMESSDVTRVVDELAEILDQHDD